jgi:zinc D-Ala-D-Ala carboxypeptidase
MVMVAALGSLAACDGRSPVHEAFDLTAADLEALVSSLPESISTGIASRPWYFLELLDRTLSGDPSLIVLVDKQHALVKQYAPDDLVSLTRYDITLNRSDLQVSRRIMPDLLAMVEAARIAGIELVASSAYRTYDYQAMLYARNVAELGEEAAARESAKPGTSQHQLGTAIDFGSITDEFAFTPAGKWLLEHAWQFGFSLSYPDGYEDLTGYRYESWHYRYLGRSATLLEREFFGSIQQLALEFIDSSRARIAASRRPRQR